MKKLLTLLALSCFLASPLVGTTFAAKNAGFKCLSAVSGQGKKKSKVRRAVRKKRDKVSAACCVKAGKGKITCTRKVGGWTCSAPIVCKKS